MQQMLFDGFLRLMTDQRFQGLIGDFYALRGQLSPGLFLRRSPKEKEPRYGITQEGAMQSALRNLFTVIRVTMQDQHALSVLDQYTQHRPAVVVPSAAQLSEAIGCVRSAEEMVLGPAFEDAMVVLEIIRQKLEWDPKMTAPDVLGKLDDFLVLLGLQGISILALWEKADDLGDQRTLLYEAVQTVFRSVQTSCVRR